MAGRPGFFLKMQRVPKQVRYYIQSLNAHKPMVLCPTITSFIYLKPLLILRQISSNYCHGMLSWVTVFRLRLILSHSLFHATLGVLRLFPLSPKQHLTYVELPYKLLKRTKSAGIAALCRYL